MTERDTELAEQAEAFADRNFKGEINWGEAYESKLIELVRPDEREAMVAEAAKKGWAMREQQSWVSLTKEETDSALSKYQSWYEFASHLENILKEKNQ